MDFSVISKAHIEQALVRLRAGEVPPDFLPSTDYDVVVGGERFPPKQVIALAHHEATGIMPAPSEFKGGKKGRAFNKLEEHGFIIEPKLAFTAAWLFQGNPDKFDVDGYLASRTEFCWTVNQHRQRIKAGDRVYIWRSGKMRVSLPWRRPSRTCPFFLMMLVSSGVGSVTSRQVRLKG